MKTILLSIIGISMATALNAAVLIVDINGNAPSGVYTTISAALIDANAGDTLLLIPSTGSYGNVTINSSITLLGVGFNPESQSGLTSKVGTITINVGVSGAAIVGVETNRIRLGNTTSGSVSNIMIENNKIGYLENSASNLSSIFIRQNLFEAPIDLFSIRLTAATQNAILVSNNIFSRISTSTRYRGVNVTTGGVDFLNNLFIGGSSQVAFDGVSSCTIENNIIYGLSPGTADNSTFNNNISFGGSNTTLPPSGTNNTGANNQAVDPNFVNLTVGTTTYLYTMDASLNTGSPALTAGVGNNEIGIFGGSSPFKTSGSVVPVVQTLDLPSSVQEGTNTEAEITVTGN